MDIWEILGIEETFDKTEIKRAYARKAKLYHPEEHPKEYQRLRSAYRMAVKLAEESKKAMEIDAGVPVGENHGQPEIVIGNGSQAETVPDMQAEENRTQMWEDDTEKPSEGENPYNYEEVASYVSKENEEQFFLEFELLMENPCLTNQINCFRALFSREEYRSLFSDAGVRRKLGERMAQTAESGGNNSAERHFHNSGAGGDRRAPVDLIPAAFCRICRTYHTKSRGIIFRTVSAVGEGAQGRTGCIPEKEKETVSCMEYRRCCRAGPRRTGTARQTPARTPGRSRRRGPQSSAGRQTVPAIAGRAPHRTAGKTTPARPRPSRPCRGQSAPSARQSPGARPRCNSGSTARAAARPAAPHPGRDDNFGAPHTEASTPTA